MTSQEAINKMIAPGTPRPGKYRQGVIQIHITRACDKSCFGCTQGSNLGGKVSFITPDQFESAVLSLKGYFGVVGLFGGNPAIHPQFDRLCEILRKHIPFNQRGLWCNNPLGKGKIMRQTFDPSVSNLNVHLDKLAYEEFKRDWPECRPVGLETDSRHSPPYVAIKDVLLGVCTRCEGVGEVVEAEFQDGAILTAPAYPNVPGYESRLKCVACEGTGKAVRKAEAWDLISNCDINKHWSAMIGVFRNGLRGWFCEIAGAQAMLHQHEEDYPDTGIKIRNDGLTEISLGDGKGMHIQWWRLPISNFSDQILKHCMECGVPLRGHGELAQSSSPESAEQVSATHYRVYKPKRVGRRIELVTQDSQLGERLGRMTDYLGNAKR